MTIYLKNKLQFDHFESILSQWDINAIKSFELVELKGNLSEDGAGMTAIEVRIKESIDKETCLYIGKAIERARINSKLSPVMQAKLGI
jgi:hypothetical protein